MIALVFALEYESAALREPLRLCATVWHLGITGRQCADPLERHLKHTKPSLVVSAGFSGGLQPELTVGSLLIGENLSHSHITRMFYSFPDFRFGKFITADCIVDTSSAKRTLGGTSGALAVDCESQYIRNICDLYEVPMLAVRCISDTVDQDLPVPGSILINNSTGRPDPLGLFKYLLSHPASIQGFRKMIRNSRIAQKALADGLSTLIPRLLKLAPIHGM